MTDSLARAPATGRACPSCGAAMRQESYERRLEGRVDLDFCDACQAIWFDAYESTQLTPGAVMKVFEAIARRREVQPRALADVCRCPACRRALALTHDIQRANRITYYRCPEGHGRFTTYYQFLREKNFVRSLTVPEIEKLKAVVKQVRCTSCGAPVSLERDPQCPFCGAPISMLDPDAATRALAELASEEQKRRAVDPHAAIDALLAGQRSARATGAWRPYDFQPVSAGWTSGAVDLIGEAVDFFMNLD
ncbi:MAG TPA: zf-TFIIB domain-containing protein [Usitatibacter sp.]